MTELPETTAAALDEWYQRRWGTPADDAGWPDMLDRLAEALIARAGTSASVLDAACGAGLLVQALRKRGAAAVGSDVDAEGPELAPAGARPFCGSRQPGDALPGHYDVAVCINVSQTLSAADAPVFFRTVTAAADAILFAETGTAASDPEAVLNWLQMFTGYGFAPELDFDASFFSPAALLLRRKPAFSNDVLQLFVSHLVLKHARKNGAAGNGQTARFQERSLQLERQLTREREYLDTLRGVHAYLVQEVQRLRENRPAAGGAAAPVNVEEVVARVRAELGGMAGQAGAPDDWRGTLDTTETRSQITRLERRALALEQAVEQLRATVESIINSRIWQTMVSAGGVILRLTGRGRGR